VTTLFSVCIVLSLALDAAVLFTAGRWRQRIAVALVSVLALVWIFLGVALVQIALRLESPIIPAAGVQRPTIAQAGREALVVLASLGGPALLATFLGTLAIRGSRRRRPRPGYMERIK
jgi:hypothetical protein